MACNYAKFADIAPLWTLSFCGVPDKDRKLIVQYGKYALPLFLRGVGLGIDMVSMMLPGCFLLGVGQPAKHHAFRVASSPSIRPRSRLVDVFI